MRIYDSPEHMHTSTGQVVFHGCVAHSIDC